MKSSRSDSKAPHRDRQLAHRRAQRSADSTRAQVKCAIRCLTRIAPLEQLTHGPRPARKAAAVENSRPRGRLRPLSRPTRSPAVAIPVPG
jgi:hypothetical protein